MQHKNNSRGKEWWLWQRKWWCHWQALKYLYHNGFCGRTHKDCAWEERRSFSGPEQSLPAVSTETSVKAPVTSCLDVSVLGIWSSSELCLHPQMSISDSPASSVCMFALHHQSSSSPAGPLNPDSSNMSAPMPPLDTGLYGQPMAYPKTPDGRSMEQMMGFVPYSSCLSSISTERAAQQNQQVTQKLFKPLPGEASAIVIYWYS